ncbi:MAG: potassium transporter Kup [Methylococcus sp.]|jgi:KUP system potassium uptake protein|nr:MAG: potassium transporter Kup [Methylococcus sp.]
MLTIKRGSERSKRLQWGLVLSCMGVVFGDIATSPLYALRVAFGGRSGLSVTPDHVLGVLSMVFWLLIVVVCLKYALLIMRLDNKGEGGIMALLSLVQRTVADRPKLRQLVLSIGLLGAALFFGDAVITPAISVMSAVEGLKLAAPSLKELILPITLVILVILFLIQRRGTAFIAGLFSPVMVLWLLVIAVIGANSIAKTPVILEAINPIHALHFMLEAKMKFFIVLGAVVLVVTGAEALYADIGHFGIQPIRVAWVTFVFPALVINYLGQGALLLRDPAAVSNPFYLLAPSWGLLPLLCLATFATIIASQAVISGAFSLSAQAVRMRYLPRLSVRHTSDGRAGQIYVPAVNWTLGFGTAALVIGFGASSKLAGAYGLAVTGTMVVTTLLAFGLLRRIWRTTRWVTGLLFLMFLLMDLVLLLANIPRIQQGGWVSLAIAGAVYLILSTWTLGRELLLRRLNEKAVPLEELVLRFESNPLPRVPGTAVYLTASRFGAPLSLLQNMKVNKILHQQIIVLTVVTRDEPWIPLEDRVKIRSFGDQIYRVRIYYGYNQEPDIPDAMMQLKPQGLEMDVATTTFFLSREHMIASSREGMSTWRERFFIRMAMNAENAMRFWRIPADRVVELGLMVEL